MDIGIIGQRAVEHPWVLIRAWREHLEKILTISVEHWVGAVLSACLISYACKIIKIIIREEHNAIFVLVCANQPHCWVCLSFLLAHSSCLYRNPQTSSPCSWPPKRRREKVLFLKTNVNGEEKKYFFQDQSKRRREKVSFLKDQSKQRREKVFFFKTKVNGEEKSIFFKTKENGEEKKYIF